MTQETISALVMENTALKQIIERMQNQVQSYDQTLHEVISANINLKAGCKTLEKVIETKENSLKESAAIMEQLQKEISALKVKPESSDNIEDQAA